jgi:hypothetical protein
VGLGSTKTTTTALKALLNSGVIIFIQVHSVTAPLRLAHLDLTLLATTDSIGSTDSLEVGVDTTALGAAHLDVVGSVIIAEDKTAIGVELGIALLLRAGTGVQEAQAGLGSGDVGQSIGC